MTTELAQRIENKPMQLIEMAVQANADPDKLEKLMELQERYEANEARKQFAVAMQQVQQQMPTVIKDKDNSHTRSRYASEENVMATIKPAYLQHGFTLAHDEVEAVKADNIRVRATLRHVGGHTEQYFREGPLDNKGAKGAATKTDLHGNQSTFSYLCRTLTLDIFGVTVADEDRDGSPTVQYITEEQAITLEEIASTMSDEIKTGFLKWMKVSSFYGITADKHDMALTALKRKQADLEKASKA